MTPIGGTAKMPIVDRGDLLWGLSQAFSSYGSSTAGAAGSHAQEFVYNGLAPAFAAWWPATHSKPHAIFGGMAAANELQAKVNIYNDSDSPLPIDLRFNQLLITMDDAGIDMSGYLGPFQFSSLDQPVQEAAPFDLGDPEAPNPPQPEDIQVRNNPDILATITPYVVGGFETIIVDKPPVPPEISFYPFKGVNNKVNILLNSNTGRMSTKPIAILDGDAAEFEQQYLTQNGESKSFDDIDTVEFVSDDPVDAYQLFRLPEEPTSYGSFNNNLLSVINPDWGIPGSLIDTIVPNRKYYYCARSLDVHNNVSNPTFIFEIQIIDNNGQVFLRQNIFTFEPVKNTFVKPGRRFIYVEPSLQQTVLEQSVAVAHAVDYPVPGPSILGSEGTEQKVWGKNFKLRLTSKKTGRKMDLNINFKNSGIVNQTE